MNKAPEGALFIVSVIKTGQGAGFFIRARPLLTGGHLWATLQAIPEGCQQQGT